MIGHEASDGQRGLMDDRVADDGQSRRAPAVVLLHAGGLDARMFDADMSALSRLGHVVRYDRRRDAPEAGNVAIDHIAELRAVIDCECGGRAVLVGSSFGGQLAVDFALAHGERVAALLLVGPGLTGTVQSEERRARMARLVAAARHGPDGLARAWLEDRHLAPHGFPAATTRLVCDMLRDSAPLFLAPPRTVPVPSALPRLGRLKAPGRVYVGELDDTDNHQIAQTLAHAAPTLELHIVRAAGHFPMLERVGWLPHAAAALLDELEARA
jgi:3-oxoadipate enol-lactonase